MTFTFPTQNKPKLDQLLERINNHVTLNTWWACSNINAIDRMHINDHGPTHIKIVANLALKLLRLLREHGVEASVVADHKMTDEDAEVIVILAVCMHDLGHIVHRHEHERFSIGLAANLLPDFLEGMYDEHEQAIITSEVLHAIYAHDTPVDPFTIEAGCVKVADALDMEKGRARIPFKISEPTIHAVSALAIEGVSFEVGKEKPIRIAIKLGNSAGIFQLDNLLKGKVQNSGLSQYIEIEANLDGEEKKIMNSYTI
jgi:hypothetical protein